MKPDEAKRAWRAIPLDDLELSVRTSNCLRNAGITTLGQLADTSDEALLKIKNFGRRSLREVQELVREDELYPSLVQNLQRQKDREAAWELVSDAIQFMVWAAGEGISALEEHVPSPEEALVDYALETGDEDWTRLHLRVKELLS